jgi:hypothetical protein
MITRLASVLTCGFIAALALPALAAPGGPITTLPNGEYVCETPGDAGGPVGHRVADAGFSVLNASSYSANGVRGTYLATDETVTMTSGPHKGVVFQRRSAGHLVRSDAATGQRIRCVRSNRNNTLPGERG